MLNLRLKKLTLEIFSISYKIVFLFDMSLIHMIVVINLSMNYNHSLLISQATLMFKLYKFLVFAL